MSTHLYLNRRHLLATAGAGAALALIGCGSNPNQTQTYVLRPDVQPGLPGGKVAWSLAIATPYAPASLNIERIALTRSAETLDYFADSAWTDRLPTILQTCLVEAFEASGRIAQVSRDTAGLDATYVLEPEIRDFAAHYESADQPPFAVIRIAVKLVSAADRTILGTFDSFQRVQGGENKVVGVVSAFNVALTASLKEIVNWTLSAPATAAAPASPATPARRRRRKRRATG